MSDSYSLQVDYRLPAVDTNHEKTARVASLLPDGYRSTIIAVGAEWVLTSKGWEFRGMMDYPLTEQQL